MAYEAGRYRYPEGNDTEFWFRCRKRSVMVYLRFLDGLDDDRDFRYALEEAIEMNATALRVTRIRTQSTDSSATQLLHGRHRFKFTVCDYKEYIPRFNSNFHAVVDHERLIDVKCLNNNVKVVSFDGEQFVYKFMSPKCFQHTFEKEVENYERLAGSIATPSLRAVVQKGGRIQGILISYIDGVDLWSAVKNGKLEENLLMDVTRRIVCIAAELERRKFYHEDLKCGNIVRRHDGELFFIDFGGGLTEGMYREERENHITFHGSDASDALFTLGRTIWELWAAESPYRGAPLDRIKNETIRDIVRDCEDGNVESIAHLREKYFIHGVSVLSSMANGMKTEI